MKPLYLDGITYTGPFTSDCIKILDELRTEALKQNCMGHALMLSHSIAILNYYKQKIAEEGTAVEVSEAQQESIILQKEKAKVHVPNLPEVQSQEGRDPNETKGADSTGEGG